MKRYAKRYLFEDCITRGIVKLATTGMSISNILMMGRFRDLRLILASLRDVCPMSRYGQVTITSSESLRCR
jgi:hypothetical protein